MKKRIPIILTILSMGHLAHAEPREWTDTQGRKVTAEFIAIEAGVVKMKLANGKSAEVPFAKLSEADQAWVKDRHANPPAPEPEPPTPAPAPVAPNPAPAKPQPSEFNWAPLKDVGMNVPKFEPFPAPDPNVLIPVLDNGTSHTIYIRPDGSEAFPQFRFCNSLKPFSDGLAYVETPQHKGYINREGKWVLGGDGGKPLPEGVRARMPFSEGRARVLINNHWAFIDTEGKVVGRSGVYGQAEDFSGGLAAVYEGEPRSNQQRWHYIDRDGNTAIAGPWYAARSFSSGVAWVGLDEQTSNGGPITGRRRLINTKGEQVFGNAVFLNMGDDALGGYVRIDGAIHRTDGSVCLEKQQDYYLGGFSEDGQVSIARAMPLIGAFGRLVHLPTMSVYGPKMAISNHRNFSEGIAAVELLNSSGPNTWRCLDYTGRFITEEGFVDAPQFRDGYAVTRKAFGPKEDDIRTVVINRKGEIIFKGEARK
jgi:SLA1 homology domain 1, SHD1/WG containing repeat